MHVRLSVSVEHKKNLFHSICTPGQTCAYPALHLARVKSAVEIPSHHAQPNKTQSCDWEVSRTALRVITMSVINSMFFSVAVCLSAICWALRHKVGWLPAAGRRWLGWSLGAKPWDQGWGTASDFISCGLQMRGFFFFIFFLVFHALIG